MFEINPDSAEMISCILGYGMIAIGVGFGIWYFIKKRVKPVS